MKHALIGFTVGVVLLSGCERRDDVAALCDEFIKTQLRSPTTYQPARTSRYRGDDGHQVAFIEFDAANAYGTPIRNNARCSIDDEKNVVAFSIGGQEMDEAMRELLNSTLRVQALIR